jgi:hypothetical protein
MRHARVVVAIVAIGLGGMACSRFAPVPERPVDWRVSRLAVTPTTDLTAQLATAPGRPTRGKFSLRFYQRLRAHPVVASLAEVDVWELRNHPRRYDIITIGPVTISRYRDRTELLDQLVATERLTADKANVLLNWALTGGMIWVEFGVTIQGHEWVNRDTRTLPPLPDLTGFTIFGLPTHTVTFEAKRTGRFTFEPAVFGIGNESKHPATADIKSLQLVQSDFKTAFVVLDAAPEGALVFDGTQVYATVVPFGQGRIVSTVPFDQWAVDTDGEKYRINLAEWLGGHPIPMFDPKLDVERSKD